MTENPSTNILPISGQTSTTPLTPASPTSDLARLTEDMTKLKELLTAQRDALNALVPAGKTVPSEGKITVANDTLYVAELCAYRALVKAGEYIAKRLEFSNSRKNILLVDAINDQMAKFLLARQIWQQLGVFSTTMDRLLQECDELLKPPKPAALVDTVLEIASLVGGIVTAATLIPNVMSLAADFVGYLKTDYEIRGRSLTLTNEPLKVKLATELLKKYKGQDVLVSLTSLNLPETPDSFVPPALLDKADECHQKFKQLNAAKGALDKLKAGGGDKVQALIDKCAALLEQFTNYSTHITQAVDKSASLLIDSALHFDTYERFDYLLQVSVVSGGGQMTTSKKLFGETSNVYVGGLVVSYQLTDRNGKLLDADTLQFAYKSEYLNEDSFQFTEMKFQG